jgi:hypothetical protein
VDLKGRATDRDGAEIPAADLRWDVILHHDDHTHPWVEDVVGASGSFTIPTEGIEENWTFRIVFTATDSDGISGSAERTVKLNYLPLFLHSEPSGLRLTANGVSFLTSAEYHSVNGASVEVGAPSPQDPGPGPYLFARWSDGGDPTHSLITREGVVVTAFFEPDPKAVFIRGDCNRDTQVDVSDAVFSLTALFAAGKPWACPDAGDANDDGKLDIADPIAILFALFGGGRALPPPSVPGFDPTSGDSLGCEREGAL